MPWHVPMRCLKFDLLNFSCLKKVGSKFNENWTQNHASRLQWSGSCDEKTIWCGVTVTCRNLIKDTCNDRKGSNYCCHVFPKSWPCDFLQAWKGANSIEGRLRTYETLDTSNTSNSKCSMTIFLSTKMSAVNEVFPPNKRSSLSSIFIIRFPPWYFMLFPPQSLCFSWKRTSPE